jgi:hypothetical protein
MPGALRQDDALLPWADDSNTAAVTRAPELYLKMDDPDR